MKKMKIAEGEYEPNLTCPFCQELTNPTQKLEWQDWLLMVHQWCPVCEKKWTEEWKLKPAIIPWD